MCSKDCFGIFSTYSFLFFKGCQPPNVNPGRKGRSRLERCQKKLVNGQLWYKRPQYGLATPRDIPRSCPTEAPLYNNLILMDWILICIRHLPFTQTFIYYCIAYIHRMMSYQTYESMRERSSESDQGLHCVCINTSFSSIDDIYISFTVKKDHYMLLYKIYAS